MPKIIIEGVIGWSIDAKMVRRQLEEIGSGKVDIEIASPGGFVFDGIEIFNVIRDFSRVDGNTVNIRIKGLAASMASYIALAGDKILIEDNATYMIHNVWTVIVGDYRDLEKEAKETESLTNLLAKRYAEKTGKKLSAIRKLMDDESWWYGEEIIKAGFADELIKTQNDENKEEDLTLSKMRVTNMFAKMRKKQEYQDDIQKAAAMYGISLEPDEPAKGQEPKKVKENLMGLEEILKENSEAKAEYDKNIEAAKAEGKKEGSELQNTELLKNERERTGKLLSMSALNISDNILDAIKTGATAGDFAIAEIERQKVKNQKVGEQDLGTFNKGKQLPKDSKTDDDTTSKAEKTMDSAIDAVLGKKKEK